MYPVQVENGDIVKLYRNVPEVDKAQVADYA